MCRLRGRGPEGAEPFRLGREVSALGRGGAAPVRASRRSWGAGGRAAPQENNNRKTRGWMEPRAVSLASTAVPSCSRQPFALGTVILPPGAGRRAARRRHGTHRTPGALRDPTAPQKGASRVPPWPQARSSRQELSNVSFLPVLRPCPGPPLKCDLL